MYARTFATALVAVLALANTAFSQFSPLYQLGVRGVTSTGGPAVSNMLVKTSSSGKIDPSLVPDVYASYSRPGGTVYVDYENGADETYGNSGGILHPYKTIAHALEQCTNTACPQIVLLSRPEASTNEIRYSEIAFSGAPGFTISGLKSTNEHLRLTLSGVNLKSFTAPTNESSSRAVVYLRNGASIGEIANPASARVNVYASESGRMPSYPGRTNINYILSVNVSDLQYESTNWWWGSTSGSLEAALDMLGGILPAPRNTDGNLLLSYVPGTGMAWLSDYATSNQVMSMVADWSGNQGYAKTNDFDPYRTWAETTNWVASNYVNRTSETNWVTVSEFGAAREEDRTWAETNFVSSNSLLNTVFGTSEFANQVVVAVSNATYVKQSKVSSMISEVLRGVWTTNDVVSGVYTELRTLFRAAVGAAVTNSSQISGDYLNASSLVTYTDLDGFTPNDTTFYSTLAASSNFAGKAEFDALDNDFTTFTNTTFTNTLNDYAKKTEVPSLVSVDTPFLPATELAHSPPKYSVEAQVAFSNEISVSTASVQRVSFEADNAPVSTNINGTWVGMAKTNEASGTDLVIQASDSASGVQIRQNNTKIGIRNHTEAYVEGGDVSILANQPGRPHRVHLGTRDPGWISSKYDYVYIAGDEIFLDGVVDITNSGALKIHGVDVLNLIPSSVLSTNGTLPATWSNYLYVIHHDISPEGDFTFGDVDTQTNIVKLKMGVRMVGTALDEHGATDENLGMLYGDGEPDVLTFAQGYVGEGDDPGVEAHGTASMARGTDGTVTYGPHSRAEGQGAVTTTNAAYGTAIGTAVTSDAPHSLAFGYGALTGPDALFGLSIGSNTLVKAPFGLAFGLGSLVETNGEFGISAGYGTTVNAPHGVAFGTGSGVSKKNGLATGTKTLSSGENAVVHGLRAVAGAENTLVSGVDSAAGPNASGSVVFGKKASAGESYTFVWSGVNTTNDTTYDSHGSGTFNINPAGGTDGVHIGDSTLTKIIESRISEAVYENAHVNSNFLRKTSFYQDRFRLTFNEAITTDEIWRIDTSVDTNVPATLKTNNNNLSFAWVPPIRDDSYVLRLVSDNVYTNGRRIETNDSARVIYLFTHDQPSIVVAGDEIRSVGDQVELVADVPWTHVIQNVDLVTTTTESGHIPVFEVGMNEKTDLQVNQYAPFDSSLVTFTPYSPGYYNVRFKAKSRTSDAVLTTNKEVTVPGNLWDISDQGSGHDHQAIRTFDLLYRGSGEVVPRFVIPRFSFSGDTNGYVYTEVEFTVAALHMDDPTVTLHSLTCPAGSSLTAASVNTSFPNVSFVPDVAGTYTLTFKATSSGRSIEADWNVVVSELPQPPAILFFGDFSGSVGYETSFTVWNYGDPDNPVPSLTGISVPYDSVLTTNHVSIDSSGVVRFTPDIADNYTLTFSNGSMTTNKTVTVDKAGTKKWTERCYVPFFSSDQIGSMDNAKLMNYVLAHEVTNVYLCQLDFHEFDVTDKTWVDYTDYGVTEENFGDFHAFTVTFYPGSNAWANEGRYLFNMTAGGGSNQEPDLFYATSVHIKKDSDEQWPNRTITPTNKTVDVQLTPAVLRNKGTGDRISVSGNNSATIYDKPTQTISGSDVVIEENLKVLGAITGIITPATTLLTTIDVPFGATTLVDLGNGAIQHFSCDDEGQYVDFGGGTIGYYPPVLELPEGTVDGIDQITIYFESDSTTGFELSTSNIKNTGGLDTNTDQPWYPGNVQDLTTWELKFKSLFGMTGWYYLGVTNYTR